MSCAASVSVLRADAAASRARLPRVVGDDREGLVQRVQHLRVTWQHGARSQPSLCVSLRTPFFIFAPAAPARDTSATRLRHRVAGGPRSQRGVQAWPGLKSEAIRLPRVRAAARHVMALQHRDGQTVARKQRASAQAADARA